MNAARRLCALLLLCIACGAGARNAYTVYTPNVSGSANGVRVIVRRIGVSRKEIVITMTLQNLAPGFATFLPYNKSVLTDDRDDVYRSLETRDWRLTDKQLFLGVRLAGNGQYTGTMRFLAPSGAASAGGRPHALHLEIAPVVREEPNAQPFSVDLPVMALHE